MGGWLSKKSGSREEIRGGKGVVKLRKEIPNPFIFKRTSSMYFDEDGDLAHEFYVEQRVQVKAGVVRWVMRKVSPSNLTPQGEVDLPFPRLNADLPVVLIDASFMLPFHMSDQVTT